MSKERQVFPLKKIVSRVGLALFAAASVGVATSYELRVKPLLNPEVCRSQGPFIPSQEIINRVIKDIKELSDSDVAIIFNSGGWGVTLLEKAPGWEGILVGIKQNLSEKQYRPTVLEHWRQEQVWDIVDQVRPSPAAQQVASRLSLISSLRPDLKIILVGWSNGASFVEETMCCLLGNKQVFAIEMGRPFGKEKRLVAPERTLAMASQQDALAKGGLVDLVKNNLPPRIFWGQGGEIGLGNLRVDLEAPFHEYDWDSVKEAVEEFLDQRFPSP